MVFLKALEEDKCKIMELYYKAIGSQGCTWNETYPSMEHLDGDFSRGDLFCLKTNEGEIVGAISIDDDMEVDKLTCWSKGGAELSRLVVKETYQNQGIARELLKNGMQILKERGYTYVHFLVSKQHKKALRSYAKLGFDNVGESDLYDGDWWCYEKAIF